MLARKLFIVARDRPDVFASLVRAVGHEPGIEILYNRRTLDDTVLRERSTGESIQESLHRFETAASPW